MKKQKWRLQNQETRKQENTGKLRYNIIEWVTILPNAREATSISVASWSLRWMSSDRRGTGEEEEEEQVCVQEANTSAQIAEGQLKRFMQMHRKDRDRERVCMDAKKSEKSEATKSKRYNWKDQVKK